MAKTDNPADRRRFVRIACPPDASVRLRAGTSARLLDLGLGGALVESSSRLTPGSVNATMFIAPDVAFRAHAHIVRAFVAGVTREENGATSLVYRAGLEFGPMSATEAGTLGTFVSTALKHAAATPAPPAESKLSIQFPPRWTVGRKDATIIARAPDGQSFIFLGAPRTVADRDLGETARASMQQAGFSAVHGQSVDVNGLNAWLGFYTGRLNDLGVVIVEAAHVVMDGHVFLIAGVAPLHAFEAVRNEFFTTINSFGAQADTEAVCLVTADSSGAGDVFRLAAAASVA